MAYNQDNIVQMQLMKYDLFKSQNPETGRFDVIFEVGGKLLYAHHNMLNLISDTFDAMLADRWIKNKEEPIKIADYRFGDFYQFLAFLYSGECELTNENIYSMVDIAEFYGVGLFKIYCDKYLAALTITAENVFQLMELAEKYSMVQLKSSIHRYITQNFQSFAETDEFLGAEKFVIQEIFTSVKDNVKTEDLWQAVYNWCEKQSTDAQNADRTLNLNDQIKVAMSDFLPQFCFDKMDLRFLLEFLVPRGFIFSSLNELSKVLCGCIVPKVKVTNGLGHILHGELKCDSVFIDVIKALKSSSSIDGNEKANWWKCNKIVSNKSPLKKREGVDWYLLYYPFKLNQYIGIAHRSENFVNEYVLAELTIETSAFKATPGSKIEIE